MLDPHTKPAGTEEVMCCDQINDNDPDRKDVG